MCRCKCNRSKLLVVTTLLFLGEKANRDMNCHPIRLKIIQDRITFWICASIKSIPG